AALYRRHIRIADSSRAKPTYWGGGKREAFQEVIDLDGKVKNITVEDPFLSYESLCARIGPECATNAILEAVNYNASEILSTSLSYPFNNGTFLGTQVGEVTLKSDGQIIESANAIRLFYFLQENTTRETDQWLLAFLKVFSEESSCKTGRQLSVSYFTSVSRDRRNSRRAPQQSSRFFSVTYCLCHYHLNFIMFETVMKMRAVEWASILFTAVFCPWVVQFCRLGLCEKQGVGGHLRTCCQQAWLECCPAFGLLLLCGMPFAMTVATSPFPDS
ncbi:hypothetical protein NFI96_027088, partial [Prochilodus magdalenae]